jgi:hypothetical protein
MASLSAFLSFALRCLDRAILERVTNDALDDPIESVWPASQFLRLNLRDKEKSRCFHGDGHLVERCFKAASLPLLRTIEKLEVWPASRRGDSEGREARYDLDFVPWLFAR